jgi:hypothetical protein
MEDGTAGTHSAVAMTSGALLPTSRGREKRWLNGQWSMNQME